MQSVLCASLEPFLSFPLFYQLWFYNKGQATVSLVWLPVVCEKKVLHFMLLATMQDVI